MIMLVGKKEPITQYSEIYNASLLDSCEKIKLHALQPMVSQSETVLMLGQTCNYRSPSLHVLNNPFKKNSSTGYDISTSNLSSISMDINAFQC